MPDKDRRVEDAIGRLAEVLSNRETRDDFAKSPRRLMEAHGIEHDAVPEDLVETLRHLSPEEWDVLDRVKGSLADAKAVHVGVQIL